MRGVVRLGIVIVLLLIFSGSHLKAQWEEKPPLRDRLFHIVDQIGCGGRTNPGARTTHKAQYKKGDSQFTLQDPRTPEQIRKHLEEMEFKVVETMPWS